MVANLFCLTIQDEKGWDPVCATEEIYGTIRGATLGISSPVYLIARVKNSEEHYSTWHARPAPSIYAFVFKNLKDAYEVEEDTFMNDVEVYYKEVKLMEDI